MANAVLQMDNVIYSDYLTVTPDEANADFYITYLV